MHVVLPSKHRKSTRKDKISLPENSMIYEKVVCGKKYTGQIRRTVKVRFKEYCCGNEVFIVKSIESIEVNKIQKQCSLP